MAGVIATIITILLFIGAGAWVGLILYWGLGKMGIWKFATYRRLKRRFKDYQFKDDILFWCIDKITKKWKYKDIRTISKYHEKKAEIIYTYLSLLKLSKEELQMLERGSINDGQRTNGVKGESSEIIPKIR